MSIIDDPCASSEYMAQKLSLKWFIDEKLSSIFSNDCKDVSMYQRFHTLWCIAVAFGNHKRFKEQTDTSTNMTKCLLPYQFNLLNLINSNFLPREMNKNKL